MDQPALAGFGPLTQDPAPCGTVLQNESEMLMKAQPKASHYINGRYVEDEQGASLPVIYPATGETIQIPAKTTLKFRVGKGMKDTVLPKK